MIFERGMQRMPHTQARQMKDGVDRAKQGLQLRRADIRHLQVDLFAQDIGDVLPFPVGQIIYNRNVRSGFRELADYLRPDEAGSAGYQYPIQTHYLFLISTQWRQ